MLLITDMIGNKKFEPMVMAVENQYLYSFYHTIMSQI